MTPLEITIAVGQRVTFVNNDVRAHDVVGGIDPAHPDCPEIMQAGFLTPGQRARRASSHQRARASTTITPRSASPRFRGALSFDDGYVTAQ